MRISDVKVNGLRNPIGYEFERVVVAWKIRDAFGKKVKNVKIEVALDNNFNKIIYCVQDRILDSAGTPLDFELSARTRYFIRITVVSDQEEIAVSVGENFFETGKMKERWTAKWIKPRENDKFHPEFKKVLKLDLEKKLKAARLYISGLGLYHVSINGKNVTEEVLTPYYSNYHYEIQYQTYDITELIDSGCCNINILLGNGWYKGSFGLAHKAENFGSEFLLLAEVIFTYEDGTECIWGTDDTWEYRGSDIEFSDIYDGECVNHLLWDNINNPWKKAILAEIEGQLVERYSMPTVEKEDMLVKEIIYTPANEIVLDFGQNFAGYVCFDSRKLKKGDEISLDFGEILQDGCFYNENYRTAKSQFKYISDGRGEWVKPLFTFFGFRYVKVTGWTTELLAKDFIGKVVYADMDETGFIETGHSKVNRLFLNAKWGQKSNSIDFPTDCPQRDERLGWTGDAQVFSATASYNMDTAAFYNKFIHDLRTEQIKLDGILPGVIPVWEKNDAIFSCVWGDIATFLPTVLFEHYHDTKALEAYYPMMKEWVDKIDREDARRGRQYLFNYGNQLGDWLALDGRTEQSNEGNTDAYYIASCYYAASAQKTSDAARILGFEEDVKYYQELHNRIVDAIFKEYFTRSGRLAIDTQTAYIVALHFNIYIDRQRIIDGLRTRLYKDCYKLKGGFVGAPLMCRVMAENELEEEAFYFLLQEEYPGWINCVNLGATTIWERWNSVLQDGKLSGVMMNSLNHYSFGAVVEFLYRNVAGLKAIEPGFKHVEISPLVNRKLQYVKMAYDSAYGTYRVEWNILKDGKIHVLIEIPFDCSASVKLPLCAEQLEEELSAGRYEYTYMPTQNLRCKYTKKTLFKDMMQDPEAVETIERVAPLLMWALNSQNQDYLHESLLTLQNLLYMGFSQEMLDKLTEEILAICEEE